MQSPRAHRQIRAHRRQMQVRLLRGVRVALQPDTGTVVPRPPSYADRRRKVGRTLFRNWRASCACLVVVAVAGWGEGSADSPEVETPSNSSVIIATHADQPPSGGNLRCSFGFRTSMGYPSGVIYASPKRAGAWGVPPGGSVGSVDRHHGGGTATVTLLDASERVVAEVATHRTEDGWTRGDRTSCA